MLLTSDVHAPYSQHIPSLLHACSTAALVFTDIRTRRVEASLKPMGAVAALSAQAFNQALLASSWFLQEESDLEDLVDFSTITHSLIGHNFVMPFSST